MRYTFWYCPLLEGTIEINANPTEYEYCFGADTRQAPTGLTITLTGESTMLQELAETSPEGYRTILDINGNVLRQ
jgi:hypothetical protein